MKLFQRCRDAAYRSFEAHRQVKLGTLFLLLNLISSLTLLGLFSFYFWDIYTIVADYFQLSEASSNQVLDKVEGPVMICGCLVLIFLTCSLVLSVKHTGRIYNALNAIGVFIDKLPSSSDVSKLNLQYSRQLAEISAKLNGLKDYYDKPKPHSVAILVEFMEQHMAGKAVACPQLEPGDPLTLLAHKLEQFRQAGCEKK